VQSYISSYFHHLNTFKIVKIFGYCSRGVPGIEIVGFSGKNKILKEKVIYISKRYNIKIPHKKYVLCLDSSNSFGISQDSFRKFELPLIILFWKLSKNVEISMLEKCISIGSFNPTGKLESQVISRKEALIGKDSIWIGNYKSSFDDFKVIDFENIIKEYQA